MPEIPAGGVVKGKVRVTMEAIADQERADFP